MRRIAWNAAIGFGIVLGALTGNAGSGIESVNPVEVYLAHWWGTEGSVMGRPDYRVSRIDNGELQIHYSISPGRMLGDTIMPYWSIKSVFSFLNVPGELAHRPYATFVEAGEEKKLNFIPRSGIELAQWQGIDVLKIRNRSIGCPEDTTTDTPETNPLMIENVFCIGKNRPVIPIAVRVTNTGSKPLARIVVELNYEQNFNWSDFGVAQSDSYQPTVIPADGKARAFFAYSSGMKRGYEFLTGQYCELLYALTPEMNTWKIVVHGESERLAPGESFEFSYALRILKDIPEKPSFPIEVSRERLHELPYRRIQPKVYKKAPIQTDGRVMLPQVIADLDKPKIRGLNLRDGFPRCLESLDLLQEWGCNLIVTGIGDPDSTAKLIEKGHQLGMEMFMSGHGNYRTGSPDFSSFYSKSIPISQQPDSHGQDEDHYYWHSIKPSLDFEAEFGKPMAEATHDEKVLYWGRCFADKWKNVMADIEPHTTNQKVWYYVPFPSIAFVDPLDSYDLFLPELTSLGEPLTVFPFYYGIEYNQAEYMVRRWKDAGGPRVVFLPMTDFLVRPSQFFRVITASRRGQADGMCGFNFPVLDEKPEKIWQWKSVLLAAQANFPTPELDAFCFMEEPAELIEKLAVSDITVVSEKVDVTDFVKRLQERLPGKIYYKESAPNQPKPHHLTIVIGNLETLQKQNRSIQLPTSHRDQSKGFIQMQGSTADLCGTDSVGIEHALTLFTRFAELARSESGN